MGLNKIVFTKQHDSMQCGIACLAMVCSYYNKNIQLNFSLVTVLQQPRVYPCKV